MKGLILSLVFLSLATLGESHIEKMYLVYETEVPKFTHNPDADGYQTTIPRNIPIVDADFWKDEESKREKIFVTSPRLKPATPASLSTLVYCEETKRHLLEPYPSWKEHDLGCGSCDKIVSVFRIKVDEYNRLWVLDTGIVDALNSENGIKLCQPKVLIYDLKTDQLIGKYEVPNELLVSEISALTTIVVDNRDSECKNSYAYIADPTGNQVIVFEVSSSKFWRFKDKNLYPTPADGTFDIAGASSDVMDGVNGLALGPIHHGDRTLYYHSLSSHKEGFVQASVLRNESLSGGLGSAKEYFHISSGTRSSQSAAQAMTEYGALIFGLLSENALACWPSNTPYEKQNIEILAKDDVQLQYLSGVKINGNVLILVSSKLQNFYYGEVNEKEINYRVFLAYVDYITQGTKCH